MSKYEQTRQDSISKSVRMERFVATHIDIVYLDTAVHSQSILWHQSFAPVAPSHPSLLPCIVSPLQFILGNSSRATFSVCVEIKEVILSVLPAGRSCLSTWGHVWNPGPSVFESCLLPLESQCWWVVGLVWQILFKTFGVLFWPDGKRNVIVSLFPVKITTCLLIILQTKKY